MSPTPEGLEAAFAAVGGFTFGDVPRNVVQTQVRAIRGSVRGFGRLTQAVVKSAEKEGEIPVVVTLASIKPNRGRTAMDLFGAILSPLSATGRLSRALAGQAYLIEGDRFQLIITPVGVEPQLLILVATGATGAPVKGVAGAMLASLS